MEYFRTDYKNCIANLHKKRKNHVIILLYHGVTRSKSIGIENYSNKHLNDFQFYEQMKYLKNNCNPISINEYLNFCKVGKGLPQNSVIVSFDDGFENNYSVAAPILEELKIPAIFYVASGVVNTTIMFWVDELEDCINKSKKSYINIKLDKEYNFQIDTNSRKIKAINRIKNYIKASKMVKINKILECVKNQTGVQSSVYHAENYAKITWDQLKEMNSNKLFCVGGHSLYHDILAYLSLKRLKKEIQISIKLLEYHLGEKIRHYSYPEGQKEHFNLTTINLLKSNGIICCPSAIMGFNTLRTDPFRLKRIMVGFSDIPFPYFD